MDQDKFINYVASYFYNRGYWKDRYGSDKLNENEYKQFLEDCLECYKKSLADERKESPHHHTNRLD